MGTLAYMAPEMGIEEEEKTDRVDMFSFGVMVLECACGYLPNPGGGLRRQGRSIMAVPEVERRGEDLARMQHESLRELVMVLLDDEPDVRWSAQQTLDFLLSMSLE